jgi:hypothetical protein
VGLEKYSGFTRAKRGQGRDKVENMLNSKFWAKYFKVYDVLRKIELILFFQIVGI